VSINTKIVDEVNFLFALVLLHFIHLQNSAW